MSSAGATIFVGVYGKFTLHPWLSDERLEHDAYSLFAARSVALGWSSNGPGEVGSVLWGMNDAGQDWAASAPFSRVAWFQVGLAYYVPARPLPVAPLLASIEDSMARVGILDLDAVQLLLPIGLAGDARSDFASGLAYFALCEPGRSTAIRLSLASTTGEDLRDLAEPLVAALAEMNQEFFGFERVVDIAPPDARLLFPPVAGELWTGTGEKQIAFGASVPEWTLDAIGWLVTAVVDACRRSGVITAPVLLDVSRD